VPIDGARQIVADKSIAGQIESAENAAHAGEFWNDFHPGKWRKQGPQTCPREPPLFCVGKSGREAWCACQKYSSRFEHQVNLVDGRLRVGNAIEDLGRKDQVE